MAVETNNLRKAAEQSEQEPVAWNGACVLGHCNSPSGCETSNCCRADYTAPPKREWVGLTDEEKHDVLEDATGDGGHVYYDTLFRTIEAKLKEKNT